MANIRASFVGDDTARTRSIKHAIGLSIRASIIGRSGFYREVDPEGVSDFQFVLGGAKTGEPTVSVDLSNIEGAECDLAHTTQPALRCLAVAGRKLMSGASAKVSGLDGEEYGWAIVHEDEHPIEHEFAHSESSVFENPSETIGKASHVLLVSKSGRPLLAERLVAQQCCAVFSLGAERKWVDTSWIVLCDSHADFLQKAENISKAKGGTAELFKKNVAARAFGADIVSARDARAMLGSLHRKKTGSDLGLLDLHVADKRLVEGATRGVK
jgi:hypothetical protein